MQVIDQVHKRIGATVKPGRQLSAEETAEQQGAREGLSLLSKLKREMQTNKPLLDLDDADLGADREAWNTLIRAHRAADGGADGVLRWYDASWLLAECYLYRRIRGCMLRSSLLASFDPFEQSKRGSYHKSIVSITALADFTVAAAGPGHGTEPEPGDQAAFDIMVQFALWVRLFSPLLLLLLSFFLRSCCVVVLVVVGVGGARWARWAGAVLTPSRGL